MEKVLEIFNIDETKFLYYQKKNTAFVKSYFDKTMQDDIRFLYPYLDGLDEKQEHYLQFGVDKCSVNNFEDFCKQLNINVKKNLKLMKQEEINIINEIKTGRYYNYENPHGIRLRNHFYSECNKITFTCQNINNYMHYFGITGEAGAVLKAFEIFIKIGKYDGISWGRRDFI